MTPQPSQRAPIAEWLTWVDENFPFNEVLERKLRRRQLADKPEVGSAAELEDLRGVADPVNLAKPDETRTRLIAAVLARMWFDMREKEKRWRAAQTKMPTRELEQARDDIDDGIGAEWRPQQSLGVWP